MQSAPRGLAKVSCNVRPPSQLLTRDCTSLKPWQLPCFLSESYSGHQGHRSLIRSALNTAAPSGRQDSLAKQPALLYQITEPATPLRVDSFELAGHRLLLISHRGSCLLLWMIAGLVLIALAEYLERVLREREAPPLAAFHRMPPS